jgi:Ni,Fe-hydrogenase III component G
MTTNDALDQAAALLAPWTKDTSRPEPHRVDLAVDTPDLLSAVGALSGTRWGYLAAITGLDLGETAAAIEVLYHFCAGAAIATIRVRAPRDAASVPSLCAIIPSAGFFEREVSEMFGITVTGAPDASRLFLPDDWPEGIYPLRKTFAPGTRPAAPGVDT